MLKVLFGIGAMLGLSYMVADKSKIHDYSREMNRWARPLCFICVGLAVFAFLIYPLLVRH